MELEDLKAHVQNDVFMATSARFLWVPWTCGLALNLWFFIDTQWPLGLSQPHWLVLLICTPCSGALGLFFGPWLVKPAQAIANEGLNGFAAFVEEELDKETDNPEGHEAAPVAPTAI